MKWVRLPLGMIQTNAYILEKESHCLIIDPGGEAQKLIAKINQKKLTPLAILLTHSHFDHIGAVDDIRDHFQIPVYIHKKEGNCLADATLNGSLVFLNQQITARPAEHLISSKQTLQIGDFSLQILETPGHSPGSISYYWEEEGVVFSGDVLFEGSIGRTDLPGGNHEQLIRTIREKLFSLPTSTIVLSGHGAETMIETEMKSNPFLR